MKKIVLGVLLCAAVLGCGGGGSDVIRVALVCPLTGDDAAHGQGMKRGIEMAIEEANQNNIIPGYRIELAAFDDRSDPKEAVTIANQILSDPSIVGVVGHLNSGCSIPASQVYAKRDVVMLTPASTNPKLTQQGLKNVFRVCGTDDVQGSFGANYIFDTLGLKKIAIIHDKTAYGQGLAEEVQKQYLAKGGEIVSFDGIDRGEKDFKALLTRVKDASPELVFFGGLYAEAGLLTKQMKELGLAVPLFGGDGIFSNEYVNIGGAGSDGDFATMVGLPPSEMPEAAVWLSHYKAKFPTEEVQPYDPYTYDAANILLTALKQVNLDRTKLIPAIAAISYDGILGNTSFKPNGDSKNPLVSVSRVINGAWTYYRHANQL